MTKQQGLGKGLGSLIPPKTKSGQVSNGKDRIIEVPINKIQANPWQPRDTFSSRSLGELVNSIKEHGILQPIVLTEKDEGYEIIAGERRFRASKEAGLKTVPAIIRDAEEQQKLELALVENLHREDLNALEKARALRKLIDQFNYTQDVVAKKLGQSRTTVTNILRLLNLPKEIQTALRDNRITEGHARALLGIRNPKEQLMVFRKIKMGNWTVRDVEKVAQRKSIGRQTNNKRKRDAAILQKEEILEKALSTKVEIKKKAGQGQVIIHFYSDDELNNFVKRLKT